MDYCHQTYTTYDGLKYERRMQEGTWYTWRRIWSSYTLYANENTPMSGPITLSDSAANYDMLEIFFKSNDGFYSSTRVYSPNEKRVCLVSIIYYDTSMYSKSKEVLISDTSIDTYLYPDAGGKYYTGQISCNPAGNNSTYGDFIAITQVLGWR